MRSCPCGFVAPDVVKPMSPLWHRAHKAAHLARYPLVDQRTIDSLDELIAAAERAELVDIAGPVRGAVLS